MELWAVEYVELTNTWLQATLYVDAYTETEAKHTAFKQLTTLDYFPDQRLIAFTYIRIFAQY